jgi:hypothetical protein
LRSVRERAGPFTDYSEELNTCLVSREEYHSFMWFGLVRVGRQLAASHESAGLNRGRNRQPGVGSHTFRTNSAISDSFSSSLRRLLSLGLGSSFPAGSGIMVDGSAARFERISVHVVGEGGAAHKEPSIRAGRLARRFVRGLLWCKSEILACEYGCYAIAFSFLKGVVWDTRTMQYR